MREIGMRYVGSRPARAVLTSAMAAVVSLASLAACGESSAPEPGLDTVAPGETLPLEVTVRVVESGTFDLPAEAASLTTRCFGTVTVEFTPPDGPVQMNTCESDDGSSNQTNDVTGVASVDYTLGTGSFAEVTVRE